MLILIIIALATFSYAFARGLPAIYLVAIITLLILGFISMINLSADREGWSQTPFGLPNGTIRATITLIFIILVLVVIFQGIEVKSMPEWLLAIVATIIGFYFGERKAERLEDEEASSARKRIEEVQEALSKRELLLKEVSAELSRGDSMDTEKINRLLKEAS
jgi:L-asparagine transporter-like permease